MGAEEFRIGIKRFLKKYEYANAVTADLWRELSAVSSQQLNITRIMDTWTRQMGYPVLTVKILYVIAVSLRQFILGKFYSAVLRLEFFAKNYQDFRFFGFFASKCSKSRKFSTGVERETMPAGNKVLAQRLLLKLSESSWNAAGIWLEFSCKLAGIWLVE